MFWLVLPIAVASSNAAYEVFIQQTEDLLGPFGRLQIFYNHAASINPNLTSVVTRLQLAGHFHDSQSALYEYYLDNKVQLTSFLRGNLSNLLQLSRQTLDRKAQQLTAALEAYVYNWENLCMFRFLPSRLRKNYDTYFDARSTVVKSEAPAELDSLRHEYLDLQPGVHVKTIYSFMDTRTPYGYDHILPGEVLGLYFSFADSTAVRYADLAKGCSVRSRRSLKLLPQQRVALEILQKQILVWRPHGEIALSLEADPSHSYYVSIQANTIGDGFYVMLLNGSINWMLVYTSFDFHAPVVNTAYLPDNRPYFAGDSVHVPKSGGDSVIILDVRPGSDVSRAPCYYRAVPNGVVHIDSGVELIHVRNASTLHAKEACIAGSDLIPLYNSPLHNAFWYSGDTEEIAYMIILDAEQFRIIAFIKTRCSLLPDPSFILAKICTDPDNWELISSLIPPDYRSAGKLGDFLDRLT